MSFCKGLFHVQSCAVSSIRSDTVIVSPRENRAGFLLRVSWSRHGFLYFCYSGEIQNHSSKPTDDDTCLVKAQFHFPYLFLFFLFFLEIKKCQALLKTITDWKTITDGITLHMHDIRI